MQLNPDQEMRKRFDTLFKSVGGGLEAVTEYEQSVGALGKGIAVALGMDEASLYCGIVLNLDVNAWVVKDKDIYFIGISAGLERRVFQRIGSALGTLSQDRWMIHPSTIEELQRILNMYALAFLLGHECGHIVLGHIDRNMAHVQMVGETALSHTQLEDAHADMIGAFAMVSMKNEIHRMRILTTAVTAVGLLQLPVLCVISELTKATATAKQNTSGYLRPVARWMPAIKGLFTTATATPNNGSGEFHSIVRVMLVGTTLLEVVPTLFGNSMYLDIQRVGQALLTPIINAVSPEMDTFIKANAHQLGTVIREQCAILRPSFEEWLARGVWLVDGAADFQAKFSLDNPIPQSGNSPSSDKRNSDEDQRESVDEKQQRFNELFKGIGVGLSKSTEWDRALGGLTTSLANILGVEVESIYCGTVVNDDVNAFVVKDRGAYFVGVSSGITSGVSSSIAAALGRLSSREVIADSNIEELQRILNFYALAFVLGHECGHIALGHIDRELANREMVGETALSNTYVEEAHADMVGAFAMIGLKRGMYRMRSLTNDSLAVGLLQLPVLCVISEFKKALDKVKKGSGYPHPVVRLMLVGQILTEVVSSLFDANNYRDNCRMAQNLLNPILDSVSPEMAAFLRANPRELGDAIRELQATLRPSFEAWQKKGSWLIFETPEYLAAMRALLGGQGIRKARQV